MLNIEDFIQNFNTLFPVSETKQPWKIINDMEDIIINRLSQLNTDFKIENNIAIHKTVSQSKTLIFKQLHHRQPLRIFVIYNGELINT